MRKKSRKQNPEAAGSHLLESPPQLSPVKAKEAPVSSPFPLNWSQRSSRITHWRGGSGSQPRKTSLQLAWGLVGLAWEQREVPTLHPACLVLLQLNPA